MCTILAAHMPWLPPTPKPIGLGARVPDRTWRVGDGDSARQMRQDYVPAAEQRKRVATRPGERCSFYREEGHNRTDCPELEPLRNSGQPWTPPRDR